MKHSPHHVFLAGCACLLLAVLIVSLDSPGWSQVEVSGHAKSAGQAEPTPPPEQTYIGSKKCASCHFDQYLVWRKDTHAKAFEKLPAKYKKDASCLKCHTTGFGEPSGYKTAADAHLEGITCESCHGPGSQHAELCKPLANLDKLSTEQTKLARDSIYLMMPNNTCAGCHATKGHKAHPKYDK